MHTAHGCAVDYKAYWGVVIRGKQYLIYQVTETQENTVFSAKSLQLEALSNGKEETIESHSSSGLNEGLTQAPFTNSIKSNCSLGFGLALARCRHTYIDTVQGAAYQRRKQQQDHGGKTIDAPGTTTAVRLLHFCV